MSITQRDILQLLVQFADFSELTVHSEAPYPPPEGERAFIGGLTNIELAVPRLPTQQEVVALVAVVAARGALRALRAPHVVPEGTVGTLLHGGCLVPALLHCGLKI